MCTLTDVSTLRGIPMASGASTKSGWQSMYPISTFFFFNMTAGNTKRTFLQIPQFSTREKFVAHIRTCRCAPFLHLGNGWTDCAEILCLIRDPQARLLAKVHGGAQLHVRTCAPPFRISETAGRIALKFGMWLETH